MTAFVNHFAFQFKTGLRNSSQLVMNYLFPLAFYVMMGLVMTRINPPFAKTLIPAMAIIAGMSSGVLGLPGSLVESREAGIYRSFKVNGVPALSIVAIPVISTVFEVAVVTSIITLSAPAFGGALPVSWGAFLGVTLIMGFSYGSLGALIGVLSADARATVLLSQLLFVPGILLGGLMVPLDVLPASMRSISALLPATSTMQAYQGLAFHQPTQMDPRGSLLVLLASGALAFGLAIYLFGWDSRNASRRGHPALALLALAPFALAAVLL